MKLTDNHVPEPAHIDPNSLYAICNAAILKGTRDAPDPDDARHQFESDR